MAKLHPIAIVAVAATALTGLLSPATAQAADAASCSLDTPSFFKVSGQPYVHYGEGVSCTGNVAWIELRITLYRRINGVDNPVDGPLTGRIANSNTMGGSLYGACPAGETRTFVGLAEYSYAGFGLEVARWTNPYRITC
jgi:hypothetical protein